VSVIELKPVDRVRVTVLVDNLTDPLLVDREAVWRMNWPRAINGALPRATSATAPDSGVPDSLIAEPGFSALVRIERGGRERTLLFDTGVSANGMVENMRRLGLSPGDIEVIVLSHGHWDHVTGMEGLTRAVGRTRLPVMIHPSSGAGGGSAFRALIRASYQRPADRRSRRSGFRSSRSANLRSCSTARRSSPVRSTVRRGSRLDLEDMKRCTPGTGSPTR
jgi:metal-dependent hydrolase (beta-lactamase superfamily II)